MGRRRVEIKCIFDEFPDDASDLALVAIDVIRATTTAVTAVASGWRCFPVATLEEALRVAAKVDNPLLVGEIAGDLPDGFDFNNSPSEVARRTDRWRPIILLSTGGTRLLREAAQRSPVYVACLRNYIAQARVLAAQARSVLLLARATRGEFREEDQLCCAWIAQLLITEHFEPVGETETLVDRWRNASVDELESGASVEYLARSAQLEDWMFIRAHIGDLPGTYVLAGDEVLEA
jgi:2-phosphosulfolactate phosphatase